ncbi:MAG TPA: histidinol-phosphate transaminase [Balneolales bacterium]|nr:histidinol-phosphate transaminase [Balneolales bacterium]
MLLERKKELVPENIRELKPYIAGKTITEVVETYQPPKISKLASNENRLGCSPKVKDAVLDALRNIQDYPDPISRKLKKKLASRLNVKPENIVIGSGSESVISMITKAFFNNDDEAITADVTFLGFRIQASIRGIKLQQLPLTEDYRFDLQAILDSINEYTKMIYIANPNNPTGTYITRPEFESFIKQVPEDVLVVMDEAYFEFSKDLSDFPDSLSYKFDNVLTLRTFSKAYGLAGFRIGYGVGHEDLISTLHKVKLTFEPTTLAQAAALAALDDEDFLNKTRNMVSKGRQRLYSFFERNHITYVPTYSNAVMIVFPTEDEAITFTQEMLKKGVILRRLGGFGMPNGVRITIGTDEELDHFEKSFEEIYKW